MEAGAPKPDCELERLADLRELGLLDTPEETEFQEIVQLASDVFETPIALVSLVDEDRQWFKARVGLDARETPREHAFCAHAILQDRAMIVEDAAEDPRFADNPLVTGAPHIRFYAGAPIYSDAGRPLGTLCVIDERPRAFRDAEKRRLVKLASIANAAVMAHDLRRREQDSRRRFELVIEASYSGIWDWDVASGHLYWSDRFKRMMGITDTEFRPDFAEFGDRLHPDDEADVLAAVNAHLEDGTPYDVEYRLRCNDGDYVWIRALGVAERDENGAPVRMVGSVTDISERMAARLELERTNRRLEQTVAELELFTYITSHDLKSPLRGIDTVASWIEDMTSPDTPPKIREYAGIIRRRTGRLQRLIDDLLSYYRVGKDSAPLSEVDLHQLAQTIHDNLGRPEFALKLVSDVPVRLTTAAAPLDLVLRNLMSNAIKHHDRDSGRIEIAWKDQGDCLEISVADDGPGIDPRYHARIFDLFQTLKPKDEVEGGGMGLSVLRRTLTTIGHDIRIESDPARTRGARFVFTWPKAWPVEGAGPSANN